MVDEGDGNKEPAFVLTSRDPAFEPFEWTGAYSDVISEFEERTTFYARTALEADPDSLDLVIIDGGGCTVEREETYRPGRSKHIPPLRGTDARKYISRKDGGLEFDAAIFPSALGNLTGKKDLD